MMHPPPLSSHRHFRLCMHHHHHRFRREPAHEGSQTTPRVPVASQCACPGSRCAQTAARLSRAPASRCAGSAPAGPRAGLSGWPGRHQLRHDERNPHAASEQPRVCCCCSMLCCCSEIALAVATLSPTRSAASAALVARSWRQDGGGWRCAARAHHPESRKVPDPYRRQPSCLRRPIAAASCVPQIWVPCKAPHHKRKRWRRAARAHHPESRKVPAPCRRQPSHPHHPIAAVSSAPQIRVPCKGPRRKQDCRRASREHQRRHQPRASTRAAGCGSASARLSPGRCAGQRQWCRCRRPTPAPPPDPARRARRQQWRSADPAAQRKQASTLAAA
jgi:hypothetical protein